LDIGDISLELIAINNITSKLVNLNNLTLKIRTPLKTKNFNFATQLKKLKIIFIEKVDNPPVQDEMLLESPFMMSDDHLDDDNMDEEDDDEDDIYEHIKNVGHYETEPNSTDELHQSMDIPIQKYDSFEISALLEDLKRYPLITEFSIFNVKNLSLDFLNDWNLKTLSIHNCSFSNTETLKNLISLQNSLTKLSIIDTVVDINYISRLTSVIELDLSGTKHLDFIEALLELKNLALIRIPILNYIERTWPEHVKCDFSFLEKLLKEHGEKKNIKMKIDQILKNQNNKKIEDLEKSHGTIKEYAVFYSHKYAKQKKKRTYRIF